MFIGATKSGRRLVLLSEGLIPSVYIDNLLWKKYCVREGIAVMSLDQMIQFVIMLTAVAALFYQIGKRK